MIDDYKEILKYLYDNLKEIIEVDYKLRSDALYGMISYIDYFYNGNNLKDSIIDMSSDKKLMKLIKELLV